jgi:predicted phosphohydrolase
VQRPTRLSLQYVSDIHLEFGNKPVIPVSATHIVICGDIGNPYHKNYRDLLCSASDEYEKVFILAGNHEYWQNGMASIKEVNHQIHNVISQFNNVHLLNRSGASINDKYNIIGCTLWTRIKTPPLITNGDDKHIGVDNMNTMHNQDYKWLKNELDNYYRRHYGDKCYRDKYDYRMEWIREEYNKHYNKKVIVATHHIPTFRLMAPKFRQNKYKDHYDRFYNDLDHLIKNNSRIHAWLCGHTHSTYCLTLANTYLGVNGAGGSNKHNAGNDQTIMLDDDHQTLGG